MMKYFKDKNGQVYCLESDGSQDEFIGEDFEEMTDEELEIHKNSLTSLKGRAQSELDYITGPRGVIIRCIVAGVDIPAEWSIYVKKLRMFVNGSSNDFPSKPEYPPGT